MGEGGREAGEDLGELGAQQRGGHQGRDEVEEVNGRAGRVLVDDALGGDLAAEERQQRGEVCRGRKVGPGLGLLLAAQNRLDG
jgi:hypothetical protein